MIGRWRFDDECLAGPYAAACGVYKPRHNLRFCDILRGVDLETTDVGLQNQRAGAAVASCDASVLQGVDEAMTQKVGQLV